MSSHLQHGKGRLTACETVLWCATAGLLMAFWASTRFVYLLVLELIRNLYRGYHFAQIVELSEAGLRHGGSSASVIALIALVCFVSVHATQHGLRVSRITVIVLFVVFILIAVSVLLGSAILSVVPDKVITGH